MTHRLLYKRPNAERNAPLDTDISPRYEYNRSSIMILKTCNIKLIYSHQAVRPFSSNT